MADPKVDAETVRRMAVEVTRIPLEPADVEPIRATLEGLLLEIGGIKAADRADAEPETAVIVEDW